MGTEEPLRGRIMAKFFLHFHSARLSVFSISFEQEIMTPKRNAVDYDGMIEVSELPANRVRDFAGDIDDVFFERKGGRTFLISHK